MNTLNNTHIKDLRPLVRPAIIIEENPTSEKTAQFIDQTRQHISRIITGADKRLLVVAGPCSIHDVNAALEYADRLKQQADRFSDALLIIMRVYFEKPRTTVGWKGLIMDPHLDGTHDIAAGLRFARTFLRDVLDRKSVV